MLLVPEKHLGIIEAFGGDSSLLESYRECFRKLQSIAKRLSELKTAEKTKAERMHSISAEVEELSKYSLETGEDEKLSAEYELIRNTGEILSALSSSSAAIGGDDESVVSVLFSAESELERIIELYPEVTPLFERITAARIELDDIASALDGIRDSFDADPRRVEYVTKRYGLFRRLEKRYNRTIDEIITMYNGFCDEMSSIESSADEIRGLEAKRTELLAEVSAKAKALSAYRQRVSDEFCEKVAGELEFLNMQGVRLVPSLEKGKLTHDGMDKLELLISANAGEPPKPIAKIASGGELSRFMLALKCVIADKDAIPTMIFDEIDAGVSGIAAQKIGIKLRELASVRQVLCVTHLSQIAVMADNHLVIEKKRVGERTETSVKAVGYDERVREIARIMGGDNPSELILRSAGEELKRFRR